MKRAIELISAVLRFLPFQLLFLHFKRSHLLLILWALLFGFVTQNIASKFGIPYLFLSPEYLGEVNWLSFFILGFSIGGFFMAFHLYSYLLMGPSFPFIVTLSRPFYKFSINNSVIPTLFYVVTVWNIIAVQSEEELTSAADVFFQIFALTGGIVLFIVLGVVYFFKTNFHVMNITSRRKKKRTLYSLVGTLFSRKKYWHEPALGRLYQPTAYFTSPIKILPAREARHYDKNLTRDIFRQNHFNASMFELAMIGSFLLLGVFQEYAVFRIPSGASFVLLSTIALMLITVLYTWFKGWTITIIVGIAIATNLLSDSTGMFKPVNHAYGLDYSKTSEYSLDRLREIQFDTLAYNNDLQRHFAILDHWKRKAVTIQNTSRPKLVLLNCSGGGLRSAMWTFFALESVDEAMKGTFFPSVHMITGASGGMIGASYYRDLFRKDRAFWKQDSKEYLDNISKDMLNSVCFNLAIHDIFLRYKKVKIGERTYLRDRGFAFEEQLDENTGHVMEPTLGDYEQAEYKSAIPMMIFTPTIINDGRRLLISTQPMGFINGPLTMDKNVGPENVEYLKLFADNDPMSLRYLSAVRMNSTFPYILPMVTMPTKPVTQIMDAGIRDNYGTKTTVRYISAIKDWLVANTSGVVVVQLRDIDKDYDIAKKTDLTLMDQVLKPVMNFYGNYHHTQEFDADEMLELTRCDVPVEVVTFVLRKNTEEKIALSWHLTQREKNDIIKTFSNERNQAELKRLVDLLTNKKNFHSGGLSPGEVAN